MVAWRYRTTELWDGQLSRFNNLATELTVLAALTPNKYGDHRSQYSPGRARST